MKLIYNFSPTPTLPIPFDFFAHSRAGNPANPFDAAGVLHNALFTVAMSQLADERYRGIEPSGDSIFKAVVDVVQNASLWELSCVCVKQEGCPCQDFLDWIRSTFPMPPGQPIPLQRDLFPDIRPEPAEMDHLIETRVPPENRQVFLQTYRRIKAAVAGVRNGQSGIRDFQRAFVTLERETMDRELEPSIQQVLMISASVARHSMFMALASGRGVSEAPEWVSDDAAGATLGGLAGSPGGVGGAAVGGVAGAAIFSIFTAAGWW